jgi:DNA-binding transcriptional LysR family regulator
MSFRFDLTDLRLFLGIVECGSITAGANAVHLSLAAASARVLGMEKALAAPLFVRSHRGVTLTAAGLTLVAHAQSALEQADRLRLNLENLVTNMKTHVTLLGTSAAIREYLPDALGEFLALNSRVNISVAEAIGEEAVHAVLVGLADVALVTDHTSVKGLETLPFVMNHFALAVPINHPLSRETDKSSVSIICGDPYDVVGLNEGSALQDSWERRAADRGIRLKYRVRVPSFNAQLRLVEHGVGIALMPEATARRAAKLMAIAVLPLSDPYLIRRLLICARRFDTLSDQASDLVQTLLKQGELDGVRGTFPTRSPSESSDFFSLENTKNRLR